MLIQYLPKQNFREPMKFWELVGSDSFVLLLFRGQKNYNSDFRHSELMWKANVDFLLP